MTRGSLDLLHITLGDARRLADNLAAPRPLQDPPTDTEMHVSLKDLLMLIAPRIEAEWPEVVIHQIGHFYYFELDDAVAHSRGEVTEEDEVEAIRAEAGMMSPPLHTEKSLLAMMRQMLTKDAAYGWVEIALSGAYSQPKAILTHGPTLLSVMTAQLGGDFWIKGLDKAIGYYGADAPLVPSDPLEK